MAVVHIYKTKIEAMTAPGGMVFRWAYQRRKKVERLAKTLVPVRTGLLSASISASYSKVPNGVIMYVSADAGYATYVHEGTGTYNGRSDIVSPRGKKMHLQPAWGGWREKYLYSVKGQRPQPFLSQALDIVVRDL